MSSNGDRFVAAFNRIDAHLRRMMKMRHGSDRFADVVRAAVSDARVQNHFDDLIEFAELRNAIVHDRGRHTQIIADPRDAAVELIERIADKFERPQQIGSYARRGPFDIFDCGRPLSDALKYMKDNDYSQIVVRTYGAYGILSAEGLARWLESQIPSDLLSIAETTIADAQAHEPGDTVRFTSRKETLDSIMSLFRQNIERRVFCILITESGRRDQKPINIFTPWDLTRVI